MLSEGLTIGPYWLGVLTVVGVEVLALIGFAIVTAIKGKDNYHDGRR